MTPHWILLIWPDTEWYAVRSIGIWNHWWSCSLPVTCQTRFNSQESFGTGPSSGDGRKAVQQLQQLCPQTSLLHVIGHSKSNHHQRTHTELQRREQCPCYHCSRIHSTATCWFKDAVCHKCNKKGCLAEVRHSKRPIQNQKSQTIHQIRSCRWQLCEWYIWIISTFYLAGDLQ